MQYLEWLILRTHAVLATILELFLYFLFELVINVFTVTSVVDVKFTHRMRDNVVLCFFFFLMIPLRQQFGATANLRASARTYARISSKRSLRKPSTVINVLWRFLFKVSRRLL